jgi:hypothetical protein
MKPSLLLFLALAFIIGHDGRAWGAAPIKVACIGEHTTHSHAFPAMNRESQPVGMQEYPAMLQTRLGAGYQVRNFGDCCATVTQGYNTMGQETHPYVQGSNPNDGPGYTESVAFLPDVVVIGSWGRHDWGKAKASTETWSLPKFQTDYDDLVQRYMNLSTHPRIFVSLPVPILNGTDGPDNGVLTSSVSAVIKQVATKYNLPIVDLYTPFLGHMELYKQPPDSEGEGEHVTDAGLKIIADKVYEALMADAADAGREGGSSPRDAAADVSTDDVSTADVSIDAARDAGQAGAGGSGGVGGGSGGSGGGPTGGGAGGTTTTGSGGTSMTGGDVPASSSGGCSCRAAAADNRMHWLELALLGIVVGIRRRRRRA